MVSTTKISTALASLYASYCTQRRVDVAWVVSWSCLAVAWTLGLWN